MSTITFPDYVDGPFGKRPMYWGDEQSGVLRRAVEAYLDHACNKDKPLPTEDQVELLRAYCQHWVDAPCWRSVEDGGLAKLRESIRHVDGFDGLRQWLHRALDEGIDPL